MNDMNIRIKHILNVLKNMKKKMDGIIINQKILKELMVL